MILERFFEKLENKIIEKSTSNYYRLFFFAPTPPNPLISKNVTLYTNRNKKPNKIHQKGNI